MHMKSQRFFLFYRGLLLGKNQIRSFSPLPVLLHLRCALMTAVAMSFLGIGGF